MGLSGFRGLYPNPARVDASTAMVSDIKEAIEKALARADEEAAEEDIE